jgi:hypothetical protein
VVPPFFHFTHRVQNAIHRAGRAEIDAVVEQGRMDLRRGLIDEALGMEQVEHGLAFARR